MDSTTNFEARRRRRWNQQQRAQLQIMALHEEPHQWFPEVFFRESKYATRFPCWQFIRTPQVPTAHCMLQKYSDNCTIVQLYFRIIVKTLPLSNQPQVTV